MKYVISNNRLQDVMKNYLESFLGSKVIEDIDNFIVISQPSEDNESDWEAYMEFAFEDGRLYVIEDFLRSFSDLFGLNEEDTKNFIKDWFEYKFGVDINYVES